ncbi:MAG: hypothetical protein IJI97_08885 [Clostridia bacterium]|nr:hypothetical protein [Clostridia bacterium]
MPVIDLGSVVGPQGPQGAAGATGAQGIQGNPGPNQVTDQTSTNLNGVLFGSQSKVTVKPVDSAPTADSANLVSSGGVKAALDSEVIVVNIPAFSALPQTVSNAAITANHVLQRAELGTPSAQTGDWTVTTAAGSLTVSGSISGSTTLKLTLGLAGTTI